MKLTASTTTITLPDSGAHVQLSATYGDKLAVTMALVGTDAVGSTSVSISGDKLVAYQQTAIARVVKSWDFEEPVSWESVQQLSSADGEALFAAVTKLLNPTIDAPKGDS